MEINKCEKIAKKVRRSILDLVYKTKSPHIGSAFSCVEILIALYYEILNINPQTPDAAERDRFIMSKGHACPALYAVLEEKGFLSKKDLAGFAVDQGLLEQHPSIDIKKGIEATTGSLGHGLSIGAGMAFAAKKDKKQKKIFVLLSDGELDEGSVWEAVMFASHHQLDNLVVVVDYNKMQALGFTNEIINLEPLLDKWKAFGWDAREVDGHNFEELVTSLKMPSSGSGRSSVIIAHTIKGKGVSFMENNLLWHYRSPDDAEYKKALEELS